MSNVVDSMFFYKLQVDEPGTRADNFVDPLAVLNDFDSFILAHDYFAFESFHVIVGANSNYQVHVLEHFLGLLQYFSIIKEFPVQPLVELLATDIPMLDFLIIAILGVAFVPVVEEIIFRGCLYRFLKARHTIFIAQLISAALFALLHDNLNSFIPLVFIGFILARIYESTGSIYKTIFFHAFFNASSFTFLGLLKYSGLPLEIIFL